ncbi:hypothetical protein [Balneola vulgaris]|uniref:NAD(P)H-dependent amine dehydrogenase family protein n=1 Tax=Balneola vulgaris TaxID=287535 RepID=UPI000365F4A0|nr:hypothetical protein [Balneola vulgaris]
MIGVLQMGFGPLGKQIAHYIADKKNVKTIAVVDLDPDLIGKDIGELLGKDKTGVTVSSSVDEALAKLDKKPDVAVITTVSSIKKLVGQVEAVAKHGMPIVSTCEELSYPWKENEAVSNEIDQICKKYKVACLGTGVNPGFLMDYLPSTLTSICKDVDSITVERIQDATPRRVPFQKKIGAGLNLSSFKEKEAEGTLRHVGLKESVYFLASCVGIDLDEVTEELNPVVSDNDISVPSMNIKKGDARGVEQISHGYQNGVLKIKMHFKAAIGEPRSYDKVTVKGEPSFVSEIDGGINGDIATCAITINSIKSVLKANPGLQTMSTISVPGYLS